MPKFALPNDAETFVQLVLDRSHDLINAGIWHGVTPQRLDRWFTGFRTELDRYFGACLLDALIYRSEEQTTALVEHIFQRSLPDVLRRYPPAAAPLDDWLERLRGSSEPLIRLVPVVRKIDPPAQSGPTLARIYRRAMSVDERWIAWPDQVKGALQEGVTGLLFVDDFLGTGTQFTSFFREHQLDRLPENCYLVYSPLAAYEPGVRTVRDSFANVQVIAAETLGESLGLFHPSSMFFEDGTNTPEAARAHYRSFVARERLGYRASMREGFGRLALAYSFAHATPNNSLPLLWHGSSRWAPLFER